MKRIIINKAIEASEAYVGCKVKDWTTYDVELQTFLVRNQKLKHPIKLHDDETGILEYSTPLHYSLITSKRVFFVTNNKTTSCLLNDISSVRKYIPKDGVNKPNNIDWLKIKLIDDNEILVRFNSGTPAYFALILITNLVQYLKTGSFKYDPN